MCDGCGAGWLVGRMIGSLGGRLGGRVVGWMVGWVGGCSNEGAAAALVVMKVN